MAFGRQEAIVEAENLVGNLGETLGRDGGIGSLAVLKAFVRTAEHMHVVGKGKIEFGSIVVPAEPTGFCVARTMKGFGKSYVLPSTVTLCSSMASSSADCVLLEVRLISSASSRFVMIAPGL